MLSGKRWRDRLRTHCLHLPVKTAAEITFCILKEDEGSFLTKLNFPRSWRGISSDEREQRNICSRARGPFFYEIYHVSSTLLTLSRNRSERSGEDRLWFEFIWRSRVLIFWATLVPMERWQKHPEGGSRHQLSTAIYVPPWISVVSVCVDFVHVQICVRKIAVHTNKVTPVSAEPCGIGGILGA